MIGSPVNHIPEFAAIHDVCPLVVRREWTGPHIVVAISRLTSGERIGVFVCRSGPGHCALSSTCC